MRPLAVIVLAAAAACTNGVPRFEQDSGIDPHGGDAGEQTSGCMSDSECGAGQVCVNCAGVGECAPGCRTGEQCGERDICQLGTVCQSCPCAPGWCVLDPCRDDDGDGFVPGNDPTVTCPGKKKGDCNDRVAAVNPSAPELCQNWIDDDCDDQWDERDPDCVCQGGAQRCGTSWDCGDIGAVGCTKGCCTACPDVGAKPSCNWGGTQYCAEHYGTNAQTGCSYGWTCVSCESCPKTLDPVCGVNGSTYDNACLALLWTKVAHHGACLPGEGITCAGSGQPGLDGGCGPSGNYYCRGSCPSATSCGFSQCTQKGACVTDSDCPAGLPAPPPADCDGGASVLRCVDNACLSRCG